MKIFHHNDLDGRCAAAIVWRSRDFARSQECELIEVDYKDTIDTAKIAQNEKIVIVDFSFKPEVMERVLLVTKNVVWLDHHKTAFEYKYSVDLPGIRDDKFAGCELAWLYYGGTIDDMPRAVQLLGDYDKWALKYLPTCFEFYEGMKLYANGPREEMWEDLLFFQKSMRMDDIIYGGQFSIQYRDNYCANIRNMYGYEVRWEGCNAYATNFYQFGSKGFGDKFSQYDFCIAYIHDGNKYTVSLYSERIDVSEICRKFGGGGHRSAAGFTCDYPPWLQDIAAIRSEDD